MFWYYFIPAVCAAAAVLIVALEKMAKNAADLRLVEVFPEKIEGYRSKIYSDLSFCQISDLHIGHMNAQWGRILEAVKSTSPEFIVITGDLLNKAGEIDEVKDFLYCISAGSGVPILITPGNHDNEAFPGGALAAALEDVPGDVRVLDDAYTVIGGTLILGLADHRSRSGSPQELIDRCAGIASENGLNYIVATHNPDLLQYGGEKLTAPEEPPVLTVAGHTHAGQVKLPFKMEFTLLKKDKLPLEGICYGPYMYGGFPLYITSGLGCSLFSLRSGTRPEVVKISCNKNV